HLVCGFDAESQALTARNDWNPEFGQRTAFLAASHPPHSLTCDRAAFLGRHGHPARPAGLLAWSLDGAIDQVADPCAAFQVHIDLAPGATEEVVFVLGEGSDAAEAAELATHWADVETAKQGLVDNNAVWQRRLGAVQVTTPDPAFDLMVNRWLIHQTFASRVLARAGFQQAGGAFGFRDQLQDMMALLFIEPQRVRAHILESASRQFEEGDVLHWWHPPQGRGVRTRCSDDLLWLVYATGRYVEATGDRSILDEEVPFLSAPPLEANEKDRYAPFEAGEEQGTLFEHCRRAMDRGVTRGAHGLPLIGTGDWNDGMDRVGSEGRGESVWLAWFAAVCADAFANLAKAVGRHDLEDFWGARADGLRQAADAAGWDGEWYMRAFADDGLPWGSKDSEECQIDSISQSWAALADGPSPERTATAVNAATDRLIDRDARLIRLLTPPFDRTLRDPGYIRAYPPGVRENGGQYTHAATWLGLAHARLGNSDLAYEIFDLINPIRRSDNLDGAEHYRGEPYVVAADIRGAGPNTGQAGWTWYTGAAGWSWQLAVEGILGLSLQRGAVRIVPRIPTSWGQATVRINGVDGGALIITIENPERIAHGEAELLLDGMPVEGDRIPIPTDGAEHHVTARLRQRSSD
ncbi:MAG TPA: cyclic beta 1-2 glucan synthetase, partial [Guyparkeria sp.]|nr:cyclic beta 1-2 glucan synthetase [Guyparkeria sp.]